jgi:cytochrome c-type biogenesis protein CcmH/NrfG/4-amino-4-deoxy-L-arabinose transferase-like glycosyltransferase
LPNFSAGDRKILLAIILIALALRVVYVFDISDSPYFGNLTLDEFWYDAKAKDVLAGDLLAATGTFRVPLYIYFTAGVYAVFGTSVIALTLIQALLGAALCGLLYATGKRMFGTLTGVVAGLGFALYGMAVYGVGEILPVTLQMLLLVATAYFVVVALQEGGLGRSAAAGACLGLAFLAHPDVLPFAVMLALVVGVVFRKERGIRVALTVGGIVVCFMLLQGWRNYAIFGEFFVFSPQGAVNLYIGNARYADGKTPVAPPTRYPYDVGTDPSSDSIILGCRQAALEDVGRELSDQEISAYYVRKTLDEIRADPGAWIGLIGRKGYYFLNSYERSDIKLIPRVKENYSTVLKLPLLTFAFPISFGLVGLVLVLKGRKWLGLIPVAGVAAYAVSSVMFFVLWRYRLPAVPFLMLLGGFTVSEFIRALRNRDMRTIIGIGIGVAVLAAVSTTRLWDISKETWASQYLINEAGLYLKAGDYDRAVEVYEEAAQMDPGNPRVYFYLGKAYATEGHIAESKKVMERAVQLNPAYRPYGMLTLGVALANQGRYDLAVEYFQGALDADPGLGLAAFNLGVSLLNLGRTEEAERAFTEAEKLCKEEIETLVAIAGAYVRMGDTRKGVSLARDVLAKEPRNAEALYTVGLGLEAEGKPADALRYFEEALRQRPGSPEIMRKIQQLRGRGLSG